MFRLLSSTSVHHHMAEGSGAYQRGETSLHNTSVTDISLNNVTNVIHYKYRLKIIYYNYKGIKWERAQRVNHLISL